MPAEIIFALDYPTLGEASAAVKLLNKEITFFKVGLQLFTACGPRAVRMIREAGGEVFLDLKIHDIPATCRGAVKSVSKLGCYSTTIHVQAGREALEEAGKDRKNGTPRLWGVTVLSSLSSGSPMEAAQKANDSNIEGVVVSGSQVKKVKSAFPNLEIIVPGIRPEGFEKSDQKRVLTPSEAVRSGADYLVIGRPIRKAPDPLSAARKIKREISEAAE